MGAIGNVFLRLGVKDNATKQMKGIFNGIGSQMAKFGLAFGAMNFLKKGVKNASDFAENWSVVTNSVTEDIQNKFLESFKQLKRTSKAEFSDLAATIVGTMKSKGISDSMIGDLGPEIIGRLEDTGAFYNKTTEEVLHAFTSMISGMARPMEMLTKGAVVPLVANLDKLSEQQFGMKFEHLAPDQQTLLRMQFFLKGTEKIPFLVNNSAKTIGTFKGQLDSMKKSVADSSQSISTNLMPTLAKLLEFLSKMAEFLDKNQKLVLGLAGAFAAFSLGKFIFQIVKATWALVALATAKAGVAGGIFALVTAGAVAAGLGAMIGSMIGGSSGAGSSGGAALPQSTSAKSTIVINVDPMSGKSQATSNGQNINVQTNFGSGTN